MSSTPFLFKARPVEAHSARPVNPVRPSRRALVRGAALWTAWIGTAGAPRAVELVSAKRRKPKPKALVVLFLRGGADGLNWLVPHGDPHYAGLRPSLAIPAPGRPGGALDLDGFFGLAPAAQPLAPLLRSGLATCLPAVGSSENTRSHFEEQDRWETAREPGTIVSAGWLNRHLATSSGEGPVRAISLGRGLPRVLRGDEPAICVRGLDELAVDGPGGFDVLRGAYAGTEGASGLLAKGARETFEALADLQRLAAEPVRSRAAYPNSDLGRRLRDVARLLRSNLGVELAVLDYGGWDTHQNQGGVQGTHAQLLGQLSEALVAFARDMEDELEDVLVLTLTEFGRTAAENGTRGTDHGCASVSLALGGPVRAKNAGRARPVLGEWPGLAPEELHEGRELRPVVDFRDLLAEVLTRHLGNADPSVLAGHVGSPLGLI